MMDVSLPCNFKIENTNKCTDYCITNKGLTIKNR